MVGSVEVTSIIYRNFLLFFILLTVGQCKNVKGQQGESKNAKQNGKELPVIGPHGDHMINTTTTSFTPPLTNHSTKATSSAAVAFFTTPSPIQNTTTPISTSTTNASTTPGALRTSTFKTTPAKTLIPSTAIQKTIAPDSITVVKLLVENVVGVPGSRDVELGIKVMKSFHGCLCNTHNTLCQIVQQSQINSIAFTKSLTPGEKFINIYSCFLETDANVTCIRVSEVEAVTLCPNNNCVPDFTAHCSLHFVNLVWRRDQKLFVDVWRSEVSSLFSCNASCWNADQGSGDDDVDNDQYNDDDDSINPIIIGVVVAIGIIVVIIFLTIVVFVVLSRRKAKDVQRHRASTQALTNGGFGAGHPSLNSSQSSLEGDHGHVSGERYSIPEVGTKNIHIYNDPMVHGQDPGYAYIDDVRGITKNEYNTLDEASQYRHHYNRAISSTSDPRLRPPLPLPKRTNSEPLPYYSVAKSFGDTNDADSGQYLELIGDNSDTPEAKQEGCVINEPKHGDVTRSNNDINKNDYFELEKDYGS